MKLYVRASAWVAPNGKKYGKQKRGSRFDYRFTKRELQDMIADGVATEIRDADKAYDICDDIIGIAWNETNGYKSGILFADAQGNLYVGNAGVAQMFL
jgi:hypothetical protein